MSFVVLISYCLSLILDFFIKSYGVVGLFSVITFLTCGSFPKSSATAAPYEWPIISIDLSGYLFLTLFKISRASLNRDLSL